MRQIVLDTETTGLEPKQGHRIIEIGCVEIVERRLTGRHYHQYLQPDRKIDPGAMEVHGITNESLVDKPRFEAIVDEFMSFIEGAELIIHNAPFDVGFINHELAKLNGVTWSKVQNHCDVIDTLKMARQKYPGQRNNLDALCRRLGIDNSKRDLHGALLDSEILAEVYLTMTGGQVSLLLGDEGRKGGDENMGRQNIPKEIHRLPEARSKLKVIQPTKKELAAHMQRLDAITKEAGGECLWEKTSN
ncbi:MAG: DNA polymerase III subunit epsilon [Gammaproteobacteria bacterium]|nr:DNA polymerase III subunit epsilon [Gammaproteobacteria bacterium]